MISNSPLDNNNSFWSNFNSSDDNISLFFSYPKLPTLYDKLIIQAIKNTKTNLEKHKKEINNTPEILALKIHWYTKYHNYCSWNCSVDTQANMIHTLNIENPKKWGARNLYDFPDNIALNTKDNDDLDNNGNKNDTDKSKYKDDNNQKILNYINKYKKNIYSDTLKLNDLITQYKFNQTEKRKIEKKQFLWFTSSEDEQTINTLNNKIKNLSYDINDINDNIKLANTAIKNLNAKSKREEIENYINNDTDYNDKNKQPSQKIDSLIKEIHNETWANVFDLFVPTKKWHRLVAFLGQDWEIYVLDNSYKWYDTAQKLSKYLNYLQSYKSKKTGKQISIDIAKIRIWYLDKNAEPMISKKNLLLNKDTKVEIQKQ